MDEQNIPIDINSTKLLDWLLSRRHVKPDWQNNVIKIREKINNAIQDMPAHEGIIKLLSGQHINYYHCLKIVEILKETEADTKNLFGSYGSKRMKDWQEIVNNYQKDNVYLAEVAQMLIRNVNYEIPSLKKQLLKLEQSQSECEKKIKDYTKSEQIALKEFKLLCEQLGIPGVNIKSELIALVNNLPDIYDRISDKIKVVTPAIDLYKAFNVYLHNNNNKNDANILPLLQYLIKKGNTTVYEYTYNEKPIEIDLNETITDSVATETNSIDFGDDIIDYDFEIVNHDDLESNITLEESGIVVERDGVASGDEALTILDNPKTREQIINDLLELNAFVKMRLYESINESILMQMQDAPAIIQMQTVESISGLIDCTTMALEELTNKRIQHLYNIKHSNKYVDLLTANLNQKLTVVDKMRGNKKLVEDKMVNLRKEGVGIEGLVKKLIDRTKELQSEIEGDISRKYKGRVVNIVGGVNAL